MHLENYIPPYTFSHCDSQEHFLNYYHEEWEFFGSATFRTNSKAGWMHSQLTFIGVLFRNLRLSEVDLLSFFPFESRLI